MPFAKKKSSGGSSRWGRSSSSKKDPIESLVNQIQNSEKRVDSSGFQPISAIDERNRVEKFLNLPEKQNAFFDVLEILGRPAKGVVNAIDKAGVHPLDYLRGKADLPDMETAGQAFIEGVSGRERDVSGVDIARDKLGIENKPLQFVAGVATEVGVDPLNFVPVGAVTNAARGVGNVSRAAYQATENAVPLLRNTREAIQPTVENGVDALGRIFRYQHGWDRTLDGARDETLRNLYNETDNAIKFRTEEAYRNVADVARRTGGVETGNDVGRIMESSLEQFDEAGNALPRPQRQLSQNPAVQQAAQDLMNSNNALRDWATDNGIDIHELQGYMTHVLSQEERRNRRRRRPARVDRGNNGIGNPNRRILNERQLTGSVEDINENIGREFFEPNAYFATAIGQKRLIEYANAVRFRREILSNQNFATPYQRGDIIPEGAEVIDTNRYNFLNNVPANANLPNQVGGQYIVTRGVREALDRYQRLTTDEGINQFLRAFDTVQNTWKRFALFSPAYHLRNAMGAMFNNWIGGMNSPAIARHTVGATRDVVDFMRGRETTMFREYRQQGLGASSLSQVEFRGAGEPEDLVRQTIENRSLNGIDQVLLRSDPLRAFETSREAGDVIDQINRFALYRWSRASGFSPEEAANRVREVQFDYSRTTRTESEVFARMMPFYRWMRNNIPFQIRQFMNDPVRYSNFNKVRTNAQDTYGIEDDNVPDYMKQAFAVPVTGDGKGSGKFLSLNLPLGDINKVSSVQGVGKTLVDSFTPVLKVPGELALNRNLFYNKPIEKFEGQEKQYQIGDQVVGVDPYWDYALQAATGQIGRGLSQYLQRPEEEDQDTKYRTPSLGISSVLKDYDVNQSRIYQLLNELQRLRDQMDYIEQQTGERPKTINEIRR